MEYADEKELNGLIKLLPKTAASLFKEKKIKEMWVKIVVKLADNYNRELMVECIDKITKQQFDALKRIEGNDDLGYYEDLIKDLVSIEVLDKKGCVSVNEHIVEMLLRYAA